MLKNEIIYTERLVQVPINMEHHKFFLEYYDDEAALYMDLISKGHKSDSIKKFIKQSMKELEDGTDLHMIIFNKYTNEFIGYIGIYYLNEDNPEIGIWINKDSQNKGYGTEVVASAIKWIKGNVKFSNIRYPVDRKNIFSRRLPERFGGAIAKEYVTMSCTGRQLDIVEYWISHKYVMMNIK